jgi:hypothetical protein
MSWTIDQEGTQQAAKLFGYRYKPMVKKNGEQYLVEPSPYGRIELVPIRQGTFLAAAQSPPEQASAFNIVMVPPGILNHLRRNKLKPWKVVRGQRITDVLSSLVRDDSNDAEKEGILWSPYAFVPPTRGKLIGETRLHVTQQLVALIQVRNINNPLPLLTGLQRVGKHTVAEKVASKLSLSMIELPLGRLLTDRVFQTPQEFFLEMILSAKANLSDQELLLISDAQLICGLSGVYRHQLLLELARLPRVVLIADGYGQSLTEIPNIVALICPGLANMGEAMELLRLKEPRLELVGSALKMICNSTCVPGVGIIPGNLLFLVRLGCSLMDPYSKSGSIKFSPDVATAAANIAGQAWNTEFVGDQL